jgi:hypothetical protein
MLTESANFRPASLFCWMPSPTSERDLRGKRRRQRDVEYAEVQELLDYKRVQDRDRYHAAHHFNDYDDYAARRSFKELTRVHSADLEEFRQATLKHLIVEAVDPDKEKWKKAKLKRDAADVIYKLAEKKYWAASRANQSKIDAIQNRIDETAEGELALQDFMSALRPASQTGPTGRVSMALAAVVAHTTANNEQDQPPPITAIQHKTLVSFFARRKKATRCREKAAAEAAAAAAAVAKASLQRLLESGW